MPIQLQIDDSLPFVLDARREGLGHFDENLRIKNLDRDCVDLNLHYFVDSHLEMILNARFEMIAFGAGGNPNGAYALLQAHYRL